MDQPVVAWLERPKDKIGLDNLGTQQPCIAIDSRLLPGVTNVTDRASYFGFIHGLFELLNSVFPMLLIQSSGLLCGEQIVFLRSLLSVMQSPVVITTPPCTALPAREGKS